MGKKMVEYLQGMKQGSSGTSMSALDALYHDFPTIVKQYTDIIAAQSATIKRLAMDVYLADSAFCDHLTALRTQAAEIAALKRELNNCKHAHVTIHSKLATAATRDMPAEYWQKAQCEACGKWMDVSDIPEDAEVEDE
jgi:hypothetical protein